MIGQQNVLDASPAGVPAVYPLPMRAGCVLNLDMQDRGARILDHSGVGSHGLSYGSIPLAALYGLAREFDGTDDYLNHGSNPKVAITGSAPRTILCWVNLSNYNNANTMLSYGMKAPGRMLQLSTDQGLGKLAVRLYGNDHVSNTVVPLSSWRLVGVVIFDMTSILCLDGMPVSIMTDHDAIDTASSNVIIGSKLDIAAGTYLAGEIGMVQVYNYALSADDILAAYRENAWRYGR